MLSNLIKKFKNKILDTFTIFFIEKKLILKIINHSIQ